MIARRFLSEEVLKVNYDPKPREVKENIEQKLMRLFGTTPADASRDQVYKAVAHTVKDILADKRARFSERVKKTGEKQVYYMCMEFLLGRSLKNNLSNLGLVDAYSAQRSANTGASTLRIFTTAKPDAGLGNGGLGRLAACFMDSLASSMDYPALRLFDTATSTGCSSRRLLTAFRSNCRTSGCRAARCGSSRVTDTTCLHVRFGGQR